MATHMLTIYYKQYMSWSDSRVYTRESCQKLQRIGICSWNSTFWWALYRREFNCM